MKLFPRISPVSRLKVVCNVSNLPSRPCSWARGSSYPILPSPHGRIPLFATTPNLTPGWTLLLHLYLHLHLFSFLARSSSYLGDRYSSPLGPTDRSLDPIFSDSRSEPQRRMRLKWLAYSGGEFGAPLPWLGWAGVGY
ncbi:hypothetical protein GJ744_010141 [Endocarpon pusillum]|uniref:Uncharacterized protein n=1 Tax=Endocarpon pusillum TaxID=364733 RepID=A0A8H7AIN8_9EURO|nr:hypothetical protein GJ744_010141 [Endocarpon pusillum]